MGSMSTQRSIRLRGCRGVASAGTKPPRPIQATPSADERPRRRGRRGGGGARERQHERRREEGADRAARAGGHEPGREHDHDRREADRPRCPRGRRARGSRRAGGATPARRRASVLDREADGERRRHQQVAGEVAAVDVGAEDRPVPARPPEAVDPPRLGGDGLHEGDDGDRDADADDREQQPAAPGPLAQLAEDGEEEQREAGDEGEAAQRVGRADADRPPGRRPDRAARGVQWACEPGLTKRSSGSGSGTSCRRTRPCRASSSRRAGQRRHGTALRAVASRPPARRRRRRGRSRRAAG